MSDAIRVDPTDDVATAPAAIGPGVVLVDGVAVHLRSAIPAGHKFAVTKRSRGDTVRKFGVSIGRATQDIAPGDWVHGHNLETSLEDAPPTERGEAARLRERSTGTGLTYLGYGRGDGRVGTRNELWVLPTVGCVNRLAVRLADDARRRHGGCFDGAFAFTHQFGCSQLGDDLGRTRRILAGLARHPNAGGVLLVGLGCENNQIRALLDSLDESERSRIRTLVAQDTADEEAVGARLVDELVQGMRGDVREPMPASTLVVGLKCGGSDGLSGLSANPLVGRVADRVVDAGGTALLTEVPEMFGAERLLLDRAADDRVRTRLHELIETFKSDFRAHGQPVSGNPSPGNREGGLTTLEEKALGAVQKGGTAPVTGVLDYSERVAERGLNVVAAPGNDAVSSTALVASGATVLLFTTGRGTPLGFPVPTIKIASNSALAARKPHWIDFDAGEALQEGGRDAAEHRLLSLLGEVASGRPTRNEEADVREIAIWKDGVTL